MCGNSGSDNTEPFPLDEDTDVVDLTSSSSSVTSPVHARQQQQQRRRSSALSGPNPAETPLTESDCRLAEHIRQINQQNAAEARSQAGRQFLISLPFRPRPAYVESSGESSSEAPSTPTRDPIPTISVPQVFSPRRSRNRNSLTLDLARQLFPISDTSEEKTPTRLALSEKSPNCGPPRSDVESGSESERTPTQAGIRFWSEVGSSNNQD